MDVKHWFAPVTGLDAAVADIAAMGPPTYTTREVASRLLVTPDRVRKLAIHRKIGRMHGREWLFNADDVAALSVKGKPGRRPQS